MWINNKTGGFFCVIFLMAAVGLWTMGPAQALQSQVSGLLPEETMVAGTASTDNVEGNGGDPAEDISLYAGAAVLMDADSGRVLYGKNADTPMAMASTTKIMTCIIILENADLEEMLTVSAYAASMPKVKLNLKRGEQYKVGDLLYSLMLESHNDSAVALAEHVGSRYLAEELKGKPVSEYTSEESGRAVAAFAQLMNEKARELGCVNTWFITPNGLDATQEFTLSDGSLIQKEHCTTATELARIMAYCIKESEKKEMFLEITRTEQHSFYANGREYACYNHNAFLHMMEGALSGKTGFTNKAGYCYVGSLVREGRTFVVALLACGWPSHKTYKWSDTRELMQYGIDHFYYRSFSQEGIAFDPKRLKPVLVLGGQTGKLGETAYVDVEIAGRTKTEDETEGPDGQMTGQLSGNQDCAEAADCDGLLMREDEQVVVEYSVRSLLDAPVSQGMEVGVITYLVDGQVYKQERIVTVSAVEEIDIFWCLQQVLARYLLPGRPIPRQNG